LLGLTGLPAAAGIAILGYRLYDIDRIINRTCLWAAHRAAGAGLRRGGAGPWAAVRRTQRPAAELGGGCATLGVAALFQPARRRI
jgi:hypothetical protein